MKTVLLLGDSIRMSYQKEVICSLGDEYQVFMPDENCRFARYTLNCLRYWVNACPAPDVIHWNNGLWDTAVVYEEDGCFTPLAEYIRDMKRILRELKKTGARIIFATTTPVNPLKAGHPQSKHYNEDIVEYNNHIVDCINNENVTINDLHGLVYPDMNEYISSDHVHLTAAGEMALGKAVADSIRHL